MAKRRTVFESRRNELSFSDSVVELGENPPVKKWKGQERWSEEGSGEHSIVCC